MKIGWQTRTLGDVCHVYQPETLSQKQMVAGEFPVYGANGRIGWHNQFNHETSQLILGCRGSCGTVHVTAPKAWINGNAMVVQPKGGVIDSPFLAYALNGGIEISSAITGAAQPQITRTSLMPIAISFPISIPEQQRIVGLLDEAFAGIATVKANAEKNLQNARALFESHLQSVFSKRGGWAERKISDRSLLEVIDGDRGVNYPKASDFYSEGHCLFLNTKNVRPDGFEFESAMFITAEKDARLRKGKLKRDDIVLTTRGTIGNIGLYSEDVPFDNIRINSGMLIFRPNKSALLPAYLFELLRSEIVKEQIRKQTTGAAQPQLPIKTLANFTIPVPSNLEDQYALVKKLRAFEPETKRLASLYQRKLAALDALKKSLLHQAFTGQL